MNWRMLPPASGPMQSIVANGRSYSASPGSYVDAPDFDARVLNANGWIYVAPSGPTSSRPTGAVGSNPYPAAPQAHYFDTTISKLIIFDGATWRDPATGSSV